MPDRLLNELREALGAARSHLEYQRDLGFSEVALPAAASQPGCANSATLVITSYSIHYTKLYELATIRQHHLHGIQLLHFACTLSDRAVQLFHGGSHGADIDGHGRHAFTHARHQHGHGLHLHEHPVEHQPACQQRNNFV